MHSKKEQYTIEAALISLWFNVALFSFKFVALLIVHSLAITTDFAITVVGLTVSVVLYKSLKLSARPADLFHNYGYGKVEHVCVAMEGVVLMGIAFMMSFQSLSSFFHPKHISYPWVGFASSALSFSLNFIGGFLILRLAKKGRSPAAKAEGLHYMLEGMISAAIACAFIIAIAIKNTVYAGIGPYLDPAVTLLVSAAICVPSVKLARQAFVDLLDASIEEPSKMEVIVRVAKHADHYCNFKDIRTRNVGRKKIIELKLIMPRDMSFAKAHEIASRIEKDIAEGVPDSEVTITTLPCSKDCGLMQDNKPCPYLKPGAPE